MTDSDSDSEFQSIVGDESTPSPSGSYTSAHRSRPSQSLGDRSDANLATPTDLQENKEADDVKAHAVCLVTLMHRNM